MTKLDFPFEQQENVLNDLRLTIKQTCGQEKHTSHEIT